VIIDCHAHVARELTGFLEPLRYGKVRHHGEVRQWMPPAFDPPASPPEVLLGYMDQIGVAKTFLVQHHLYGNQNDTVLHAVHTWPDRFVGFAYLGGLGQDEAADELERLIEAGMTGLKVELASTRRLRPDFRFDGHRERAVFERLDALRRPLVLDINGCEEDDVHALRRVVVDLPQTPVVICHVGGPPEGVWQERALVARAAPAGGWVDLAALPLSFGPEEEYPWPRAQEVVRWAVDTFGAERVMWGTDYPPTLNGGTYRQLLDFVRRHCSFLSDAQRAELTGGAAERFLRQAAGEPR
jgi:predicted TIM-barrel fold metal-dependent hydrolase